VPAPGTPDNNKHAGDRQRVELVWPGKRRRVERVELPLKVVERTGEPAAQDGWCNQLIRGDNKAAISSLLREFADRINLIYVDPPFATGSNYSVTISVGAQAEISSEDKAYSDTWGGSLENYLQMMYERLILMRELLAETGSIYVHCDWRTNAALRLVMDEVFGPENFLNEIIWMYGLGGSSKRYWPRKHDSILWYSKTPDGQVFTADRVPASSQRMKGMDKKCPDCWDIPAINNMANERTEYATQKPEALLERIIRSSSREGDIVADFFCGSGTTGVVAERLGRRWIMCDASRWAIHITGKRLLETAESLRPFEVLSVGQESGEPPGGRLEVQIRRSDAEPQRVAIELAGYEPPNPGLLADQVREKVSNWSDYIDYWAVDWDYRGDVFHNQWRAYRTRKNRTLSIESDWHTYEQPGKYRVTVKVFDICGNETVTTVNIPQ